MSALQYVIDVMGAHTTEGVQPKSSWDSNQVLTLTPPTMMEMKQETNSLEMVMIILRSKMGSVYTNNSKRITSTLRSTLKMMGSV